MTMPRFCKDCKHMTEDERCRATKYEHWVTGTFLFYHCSTVRTSSVHGDCGPDAIHFEPKTEQEAT